MMKPACKRKGKNEYLVLCRNIFETKQNPQELILTMVNMRISWPVVSQWSTLHSMAHHSQVTEGFMRGQALSGVHVVGDAPLYDPSVVLKGSCTESSRYPAPSLAICSTSFRFYTALQENSYEPAKIEFVC